MIINKKRYIGLKYLKPDGKPTLEYKGVEVARRDNCPFAVATMRKCMEQIFCAGTMPERIKAAKAVIEQAQSDLYMNCVDISDLVVSKTITKTAYKGAQIHMSVVSKMKSRDPSYNPQLQDRIPYVMVQQQDPKAKACAKAEDPIYAITHGLQVDNEYYRTKQLMAPLSKLMGWPLATKEIKAQIAGPEERLRKLDERATMPKAAEEDKLAYKKASEKFDKLLKDTVIANAQRILFGGGAMIRVPVKVKLSGDRGMAGMLCTVCHKNLQRPICAECKANPPKPSTELLSTIEDLDKQIATFRTKCIKCRGYDDPNVVCVQHDCKNLYKMTSLIRRRTDIAPGIGFKIEKKE
jgi:hypothetical protein